MQVSAGHQSFENVTCQILRSGAPSIVLEILKFCPILNAERYVVCPGVVQRNEFQSVERIDSQGWVAQKAPVLKSRKWVKRRPHARLSKIYRRWIRCLCLHHTNKQTDP